VTLTRRRNRLTTHFSERILVIKRRISVSTYHSTEGHLLTACKVKSYTNILRTEYQNLQISKKKLILLCEGKSKTDI